MDDREEFERRLRVLEALAAFVVVGQFQPSLHEAIKQAANVGDRLRDESSTRRDVTSIVEGLLQKAPYFDAQRGLVQEVVNVRKRVKELEDLLAQRASLDALGIDARELPLPRFIPVRLWLSSDNDDNAARVREAVEYLNEAIGFESTYGFASERGSWFFRWWARSRDALTSEQVVERLQKAERAVELAVLGRVQAEVDQKQAAAAAQLIESLKSVPNGACAIGSVLVLKITDADGPRVMARTLTQKQMIAIERDDHLLRDPDPRSLLKRLSAIEDTDEGPASLTAGSSGGA